MNKIIKHKWQKAGILRWECALCACIKERVRDSFKEHVTANNKHPFFYFYIDGIRQESLPECKSLIHNDSFK
jgi:hypothetical protein